MIGVSAQYGKPLIIAFVLLVLCVPVVIGGGERLDVGRFSSGRLDGWQDKSFSGDTRYVIRELDGTTALEAVSRAAASGLYREKRIDLHATPWLNWSWRIEGRPDTRNEQVKSGDDYAARVYVIVSGGVFFWKTRALNYVWSNATAKNTTWPNAFAGENAMMMAVRSQEDALSTWHVEKRNVLEDLRSVFGEDIRYIDAVALMTDTDNTQSKVTAYYGDIYFTSR